MQVSCILDPRQKRQVTLPLLPLRLYLLLGGLIWLEDVRYNAEKAQR
jgi:hypothetical protein